MPVPELKPFRFGVQEHKAEGSRQWRERARAIESMGYESLYLPDHFDEQPGVVPTLMAAADATEKLRIGSLVFDNDYRHPVVLAKDAATLDVLSGGRLDLGIGAGWLARDYQRSGIQHDPAGMRIERLEETVVILKGLFGPGKFSFSGKHYTIRELEGFPKPLQQPRPPLLLGGGGRRMLGLAAREADIVHINFNLNEGHINPSLMRTGVASATDEKVRWVREAAGDRTASLEIAVTIFLATLTDDRDSTAAALAPRMRFEPREVLEMPHFLIGTVEQIVDDIQARRERYGVSYVVVPGDMADALAPVVERLAGR